MPTDAPGIDRVLVSAQDGHEADRNAEALGMSEQALMHRAGRAVASDVLLHWPKARSILVVCGEGNNGGDGYVAAKYLSEAGRRVAILAANPASSRSDAAEAARASVPPDVDVRTLDMLEVSQVVPSSDLIIDALLGRGLSRPITGELAHVVSLLSSANVPIVSIDVPSGIDADAAQAPGPHLQAARTLQLAWPCPASALAPARFAFGESVVIDIGMPEGALPERQRPRVMSDQAFRNHWPAGAPDRHKYQAGTVAIAAGSRTWSGAGELACRGAHRGGAGLVTLLTEAPHPMRWPETILHEHTPEPGSLGAQWASLGERHMDASVLGPGLDPGRQAELIDILATTKGPVVLDASALAPALRTPVRNHGSCWLTPHMGEAARLLDLDVHDLMRDPIKGAQRLATDWQAGVILKQAGAIIATPRGVTWVVASGHLGMASGGTGDVLAGLVGAALASLVAENHAKPCTLEDAVNRVAAAVYLHAKAGEKAGETWGSGLTAHDLADALGTTKRELENAW